MQLVRAAQNTHTYTAMFNSQNMDLDAVEQAVLASPGPVTQATKADYVKFHDDKVRMLNAHCPP